MGEQVDSLILLQQLELMKKELRKKERKLKRLREKKLVITSRFIKPNYVETFEKALRDAQGSGLPQRKSDISFLSKDHECNRRKHENPQLHQLTALDEGTLIDRCHDVLGSREIGLQSHPDFSRVSNIYVLWPNILHKIDLIQMLNRPCMLSPDLFAFSAQQCMLDLTKAFIRNKKPDLIATMCITLQEINFSKEDSLFLALKHKWGELDCLSDSLHPPKMKLVIKSMLNHIRWLHFAGSNSHHMVEKSLKLCSIDIEKYESSSTSKQISSEISSSRSEDFSESQPYCLRRSQRIKIVCPKKPTGCFISKSKNSSRKTRESKLICSAFEALLNTVLKQPVQDFVLPDEDYIDLKLKAVRRNQTSNFAEPHCTMLRTAFCTETNPETGTQEIGCLHQDKLDIQTGFLHSSQYVTNDLTCQNNKESVGNNLNSSSSMISNGDSDIENKSDSASELPFHLKCSTGEPVKRIHIWRSKTSSNCCDFILLVAVGSNLLTWMKRSKHSWVKKYLYQSSDGNSIQDFWVSSSNEGECCNHIFCLIQKSMKKGFNLRVISYDLLTEALTSKVALEVIDKSDILVTDLPDLQFASFAVALKTSESCILKKITFSTGEMKQIQSDVTDLTKTESGIISLLKLSNTNFPVLLVLTRFSLYIWDHKTPRLLKTIKIGFDGDWFWALSHVGAICLFGKPDGQEKGNRFCELLIINPMNELYKRHEVTLPDGALMRWPSSCYACVKDSSIAILQRSDHIILYNLFQRKCVSELRMESTAVAVCNCFGLVAYIGTKCGCVLLGV